MTDVAVENDRAITIMIHLFAIHLFVILCFEMCTSTLELFLRVTLTPSPLELINAVAYCKIMIKRYAGTLDNMCHCYDKRFCNFPVKQQALKYLL